MHKKIILVDMDGVITDYNKALYQRWQERMPAEFEQFHIPLHKISSHDTASLYPSLWKNVLDDIVLETDFFSSLPPIPGAVKALYEMVMLGHSVCICTRPARRQMEHCAYQKLVWIQNNLGDAFLEHVMIVRDKTFAHGDILIDDKPFVKGAIKPAWEHVLYDQPYNREVYGKKRLAWNGDWKEVLGL